MFAHLQVKTWVWHSNGEFDTILDNYKTYGFTSITTYGGSGDFWGNNYHPSSASFSLSLSGVVCLCFFFRVS